MRGQAINSGGLQTRIFALSGTAVFLFLAPGTLAGLGPWWIGGWHVHAPFIGFTALRAFGGLLMAAGFAILIESFLGFALKGLGTPAPIYPPKRLVVTGFYRYVRNPMYIAVLSLILGQGLIFGDMWVFVYGLISWCAFHLFVLVYEEPTLRRSFPSNYALFCANVPRWIPRLTPWYESN